MDEKITEFLSRFFPVDASLHEKVLVSTQSELDALRSLDDRLKIQKKERRTSTVLEYVLSHAPERGYLLHGSYNRLSKLEPRLEMLDHALSTVEQRPVVNATSCSALALWWATVNKSELVKKHGKSGTVWYTADKRTFSATPDILSTRTDGYVYVVRANQFKPLTGIRYKFQTYQPVHLVAVIPIKKDIDFRYPIGMLLPNRRRRYATG